MNFARDGGGAAAVNAPPNSLPLATTYDATISTTTQVTLNARTSYIEVAAIDKAIALRWGTSAASLAAYDAIIPANTVRGFFVPKDVTAVNFIEQAATGILSVTEYS